MPINDNWHGHVGQTCCTPLAPAFAWPPQNFTETWFGGEYPAGRGHQPAMSGWRCPGCSRCFAPAVRECPHCGPKTELAASTNCCGPNGCEEAER